MKKLLLYHGLCPGDLAVMTMALESLHRQFPNQFLTDIKCNHDELFKHNPLVTPMDPDECQYVEMRHDRINMSHVPFHFGSAFCDCLGDVLGLPLRLQVSRPHFYLTSAEKIQSVFTEKTGLHGPYALLNAGYKNDYPSKWAGSGVFQEIVDKYKDRIKFVQIGAAKDNHPVLKGVINLIGQTTLRELLRLCDGSSFGVGGVTAMCHFMAGFQKPYICMIGGREPVSWITYPTQINLNTQGLLPCCKTQACWKDGVTTGRNPCVLPIVDDYGDTIPTCMAMLKGAAVEAAGAILDVIEDPVVIAGKNTLIMPDRLQIIQEAALECAKLPGDMVEFGCFRGGTSKLISHCAPQKLLHVFDGFEMGIPEDDLEPAGHKKGEFSASLREVTEFLAGCKVSLHPGRFPDTTKNLDHLKFCFAHLDFDTYQSTRDALAWVWPRMVRNGLIVLDDYNWQRCPGVKRAVEELLPKTRVTITNGMQAMLRKGQEDSDPLLNELIVYKSPVPKKRIGSKHDGGYVVPDLDIKNVDYLITVGIGNNTEFEKQFAQESKAKIKMFDPNIKAPENVPNSEFFPIGLGKDDVSIQTLLDFSQVKNGRLWLKMDIENWEWETFRITDPNVLSKFEVIIIELHRMRDKDSDKKIRYLKALNYRFKLIHAHANNWGGYGWVNESLIPDAIEATYMRKDLAAAWERNREILYGPYDSPCRPSKPEIFLQGWPWMDIPTSSW